MNGLRPPAGACPGCGSLRRTPLFTARDWLLDAVGGTWEYARCQDCRTVIADPQPNDEELAAAYAHNYGPHRGSPSLVERLGEPFARREAARLVELADATGFAVDVGCGGGAMLRRLRTTGWTGPMLGIEPEAEVAARVAATLGVPVEVAPVEDLPVSIDGAGLIVLRHVIEHVRDPLATLNRLHGALVPGGLIYVATPDSRALAARVFGRHWVGYDPPRHLHMLTRNGVRRMLRESGFELVEERWDFAPQMWSGSLQNRIRSSRLPSRAVTLAELTNPLVGGPSVAAGIVEWLLRRTTMYGATARRVS